MRFLQDNMKSLTVTSQTNLRSITNKWEREITTKKRGKDHPGVIITYRNRDECDSLTVIAGTVNERRGYNPTRYKISLKAPFSVFAETFAH